MRIHTMKCSKWFRFIKKLTVGHVEPLSRCGVFCLFVLILNVGLPRDVAAIDGDNDAGWASKREGIRKYTLCNQAAG